MLVTIFHRAAVSLTTIVLAVTVFAPVVVSADPRCSGSPGVQVWEHESLNGRSWVICGFPKENLHNFNTNLNFWESWGASPASRHST